MLHILNIHFEYKQYRFYEHLIVHNEFHSVLIGRRTQSWRRKWWRQPSDKTTYIILTSHGLAPRTGGRGWRLSWDPQGVSGGGGGETRDAFKEVRKITPV